ncbi:uncharacterized protein LOC115229587 isoform X2 [Octopus sinensis]|uniref:Uncharacterized protein LOC115229587 isoform X2 n=1 Tax=Octopus sinensis TaxID=2607531 RepID=A0A7E6EJK7_9MOLL|nr:uncharacterized protein LOC115229587 isoform X2 [Octopus sinensis]
METKFLSLSVFPSWFLKLPIASSHNYKIMGISNLLKVVLLFSIIYFPWKYNNDYDISKSGIAVHSGNVNNKRMNDHLPLKLHNANLQGENIQLKINNKKTEDDGSRPYSTLEIVGIILVTLFLASILFGFLFFGYKYFRNYPSV